MIVTHSSFVWYHSRDTPLAGHSVSLIVSCIVAKHADETAYITVLLDFVWRSDGGASKKDKMVVFTEKSEKAVGSPPRGALRINYPTHTQTHTHTHTQ